MFVLVKDRTLIPGQLVQVYRNLNRDCFSIRDKRTGLVVAYCSSATVSDARFVVSGAGRARVLKTGVRSVHAYIEGSFVSTEGVKDAFSNVGYYNPFVTETFVDEQSKLPITDATIAHCQDTRVYYRNEYLRKQKEGAASS